MQLISILLIAVSILTLLSGVSVLLGTRKNERVDGVLFFLATLFALGWAVFVGIFLTLDEATAPDVASTIVKIYYISAPLMCWALMAYACHEFKLGKVMMCLYGAWALGLIYLILTHTELLHSGITLSEVSGNSVAITTGVFTIVYGAYHFLTVITYMIGLLVAMSRTRNDNFKKAYLMVLIGFGITGATALVFDFILPALGVYRSVWVGPLAMSFAWVFHYYAILRYRLLDVAGGWLKALSYIIIMSLAAIVYLAIFFLIFMSLFKVSNPSTSVIILNILMITIVILLFPVLNEISGYVRSLVDVHNIDLVYIVKKLAVISREYINYPELAEFLSQHLHYQYVGLLVAGRLYGSKPLKLTTTDLKALDKLKSTKRSIWLEPSEELRSKFKPLVIEGVAELRNSQGDTVGKILLGRPLGGLNFQSRNLAEVETALTLLAVAISSSKDYQL